MAREIGKVIQIINDWITVKIPTGKGCIYCSAKSACTFRGPASAYKFLKVPYQENIKKGDRVTLEMSDTAQNLSALIIFGLPVLLFAGNYLLINSVLQLPYSEILTVLITFIFYVISLSLFNRWLSRSALFQIRVISVERANTTAITAKIVGENQRINSKHKKHGVNHA